MIGLSGLDVPVDRSALTPGIKQFNMGEGQSKQDVEESSLRQGGRIQGFRVGVLIPRLAGPKSALRQEPPPPGFPVALCSLEDVSIEECRRAGVKGLPKHLAISASLG